MRNFVTTAAVLVAMSLVACGDKEDDTAEDTAAEEAEEATEETEEAEEGEESDDTGAEEGE